MKKSIAIDADFILHIVAGNQAPSQLGGTTVKKEGKINLKPLKKAFKYELKRLIDAIEVESITRDWKPGKVKLYFSDPTGNFRHDLYEHYKSKRKPRSKTFYALRDWAIKKHNMKPNTEADDVVAYYVKRGAIGITIDKDLYRGVEGIWFDDYHTEWITNTAEEAEHFMLTQCLMGDPVDEIPGIAGVGKVNAEKLLNQNGWDWAGVVESYQSKGLTEKDAILTRRLVDMNQWSPKKGIKLFKGEKQDD